MPDGVSFTPHDDISEAGGGIGLAEADRRRILAIENIESKQIRFGFLHLFQILRIAGGEIQLPDNDPILNGCVFFGPNLSNEFHWHRRRLDSVRIDTPTAAQYSCGEHYCLCDDDTQEIKSRRFH